MNVPVAKKIPRPHGRINIELESWATRWVMKEQTVYCIACHSGQNALYAAHIFVHAEDCSFSLPNFQYPCHELRSQLRHLPKGLYENSYM